MPGPEDVQAPEGAEVDLGEEVNLDPDGGTLPEGAPAGGGEAAPAAPAAPAPNYMTAEAFQEAMAGQSEQSQRRMDERLQQIAQQNQLQMNQLLQSLAAQRQPQTPEKPLVPDIRDFQETDMMGLQKVLADMNGNFQNKLAEMSKAQQDMQERWRVKENSDRWYAHLNKQTDEAIALYPIFKDPTARKYLENQVNSAVSSSAGDMRRVNIPEIAKGLNEFISNQAKIQYDAKVGGGAGAAAAPTGSGVPPVKGAPSKPAPKPIAGATTMRDFERNQDVFFEDFDKQMAEDAG